MTPPEIAAALRPVVAWLDGHGVRYRIGGSLASSVHGVARSTLDVDLVADVPGELAGELAADLGGRYYVDEELVREAVRRRSSFNLVHLATMVKVDVFLPGDADYDRTAFERARLEPLLEAAPDERLPFSTPEDIVLRKLLWYRDGGEVSERQWADVRGVLQVQRGALDEAYLELWSSRLAIADLLARARSEAGGGEPSA